MNDNSNLIKSEASPVLQTKRSKQSSNTDSKPATRTPELKKKVQLQLPEQQSAFQSFKPQITINVKMQPNTATPAEKSPEMSNDVNINVNRFTHTPPFIPEIEQSGKNDLGLKHYASIRDIDPLSPEDNQSERSNSIVPRRSQKDDPWFMKNQQYQNRSGFELRSNGTIHDVMRNSILGGTNDKRDNQSNFSRQSSGRSSLYRIKNPEKPTKLQPNIQVPKTYFNCETTTPRFGLNSNAAPAFDRTALMRRENQLTMINLGKIQSLSYDEQNRLNGTKNFGLWAQSSES